jgi:uncharacterized protein DUF3467
MNPESVPFYYVNIVQMHVGAYDFTMEFGYKTPEEAPTQRYTNVCTVTMGLGHAKAMLPIMAKLIAAYEQNVGQIPAPGYEDQAKE